MTKDGLTVRALRVCDLEQVYYFEQIFNYSLLDSIEDFGEDNDFSYGLFRGGRLLGVATVGGAEFLGEPYVKDKILSDVGILESEQREGLGSFFIDELIKSYFPDATVHAFIMYDSLSRFYGKIGFVVVDEAEGHLVREKGFGLRSYEYVADISVNDESKAIYFKSFKEMVMKQDEMWLKANLLEKLLADKTWSDRSFCVKNVEYVEYRAWNTEASIMVESGISVDFEREIIFVELTFPYGEFKRNILDITDLDKYEPYEVDFGYFEFMRYSDKKDKNGIRIAEGDILCAGDSYYEVVFDTDDMRFKVKYKDYLMYIEMLSQNCEIVGNKYADKEVYREVWK